MTRNYYAQDVKNNNSNNNNNNNKTGGILSHFLFLCLHTFVVLIV